MAPFNDHPTLVASLPDDITPSELSP